MRYICLVYHDENVIEQMADSGELDPVIRECGAWVDDLEKSGQHVLSSGLQSPSTATTLRERSGKLSVTEGPFAETKEVLAGLTLLEARDLNEAIQLASKLGAVKSGCVEVRPVLTPGVDVTAPVDRKIAACLRRAFG